mmetsp:Transcript_98319/g.300636  ORF Transcript_98319/g.300636 Transcript_98319/m.300636 type:complete len:256 (+) Transcript_98319:1518-2285(+)
MVRCSTAAAQSCRAARTSDIARRAAASARLWPLAWNATTPAAATCAAFLRSPRCTNASTRTSTTLPSSLLKPSLRHSVKASSATCPAWRGRSLRSCNRASKHRDDTSYFAKPAERANFTASVAAAKPSSKAWSSSCTVATMMWALHCPTRSCTRSYKASAACASRSASSKKSRLMWDVTHAIKATASILASLDDLAMSRASAKIFRASSWRCSACSTSASATITEASPCLSPAAFNRAASACASSAARFGSSRAR